MLVLTRARYVAIVLAALVASVVLVAGPLAPPANATTAIVATEAAYRDAIADFSADASGPHTITLTADIELTGTDTPRYTGSHDLTIMSDPVSATPFVVSHDGLDPLGFLEFYPTDGATLTLERVVVEGIVGGPALDAAGDVVLDNAVFLDNAVASLEGAVYVEDATVTVTDSVFEGNGGGLTATDSDVTVVDSIFVNNSMVPDDPDDLVGLFGLGTGALAVFFGSLDVSGTVFAHNQGMLLGGAITAVFTEATITDSTFSNNAVHTVEDICADADTFLMCGGGAITSLLGYLEVRDSSFVGNTVVDDNCTMFEPDSGFVSGDLLIPSCAGGAIMTFQAYVDIRDSYFAGNDAFAGGALGLIYSLASTSGTTFEGNTAHAGGAVFAEYAATLVIDSTLHNNSAEFGGAMVVLSDPDAGFLDPEDLPNEEDLAEFLTGTTAEIVDTFLDWAFFPGFGVAVNSTFTGNDATEDAGGIGVLGALAYLEHVTMVGNEAGAGTAGHLLIEDSVVMLRTSALVGALGGDSCTGLGGSPASVASLGYNFSDENSCFGDSGALPSDRVTVDAVLLGALSDNGGATATMMPLPGSPLIDAIPAAECFLDHDQRQILRPLDGNGDGTAACDIGAVEAVPAYVEFSVSTPHGTIVGRVYGALTVSGVGAHTIASLGGTAPAGVAFPFAAIGFTAAIAVPGGSITVELELPSPATSLWKNQNGVWFQVVDAEIDGTTITYDLTDGEAGDADGSANAVIVDPVGPGISAAFTG